MKWKSAPQSECQARGRVALPVMHALVRRMLVAQGEEEVPLVALSRTVVPVHVVTFTLTPEVAKVMVAYATS